MHYDIAIIGAGPAGCMAALGAKQANPALRVVLIDKNEVAGHRIGEALLTGTVMTFQELGIADEIAAAGYHRKIGASYVWGESREPWYVNYPGVVDGFPESFMHDGLRCAIHVPRHTFDEQLRGICRRQGIEFVFGMVSDLKATPERRVLSVKAGESTVSASYWIDATGQNAFFGRRLAERKAIWTTMPRVARYAYFDNVDWSRARAAGFDPHRTNIISDAGGWNWIIHLGEKGGGLCSIGVVTTPEIAAKLTPENIVEVFPMLKEFGFDRGLLGAKDAYGNPMDKLYGHPDYSYVSSELDAANWALVGDAALFLDPILSQGVTLAGHYGMMRGRAAAQFLDGDDQAQKSVTQNYHNEAAVLKVVVGEWYSNNRAVPQWRWKAQEIAKHLEAMEGRDPVEAFRFVTNLENLRREYDPYPPEVTEHIYDHLLPDHLRNKAA